MRAVHGPTPWMVLKCSTASASGRCCNRRWCPSPHQRAAALRQAAFEPDNPQDRRVAGRTRRRRAGVRESTRVRRRPRMAAAAWVEIC